MSKTPMFDKDRIIISVSLVGDEEIRRLNKEYRGKNFATDVLSFNINEDFEGGYYLGDVVVNKQQALRQRLGSLEKEIAELVKHGVLHLLGVHHEGDD